MGLTWMVNEKVKVILERIAPGQVEFFPVDIVTNSGKPVNGFRYYHTNVLPRLESINWSASSLVVTGTHKRRGGRTIELPFDYRRDLVITIRRRPADIHIWHEIDLDSNIGWNFVSDEVAAAFKAEGVTGIDIYLPVEEV